MPQRAEIPLVLVGYGDIAARVARNHPHHPIYALARQLPLRPAAHADSWYGRAFDLDADLPSDLPVGAVWVYLAPPASHGTVDVRVERWLSAIVPTELPAQVIYASTTGVYGDHQGGWVTEETPATPAHDRGRRRLDAESRFQTWCAQRSIPCTVLRVTGIYACDRLPLDRIRAGDPVVCLEESPWSNRIHADDLADIVGCLIERLRQGAPVQGVFNVSDNHPRPMTDLYLETARHFGLPAPPSRPLLEILANSRPMAREFLSESKRIDAQAIQRALNWQPKYPDLLHGLADCG
ncbi:NAD-dependent epimerase/dehydratase family protein [Halothiobacillus sp.]|uniref:NAD-dependent epimerase/dehydratase family protein n=1 Tax=Halothiobacillus sp. TaxID=1891311 RepID=UPI002AD23373|nr:NAD-dependent epimerase/dehydratase family protein [Halothiobacillus sp.]